MDLLDREPPKTETLVQISRDGAGPLTSALAYSPESISAAMPDYTTGTVIVGLESGTREAIALFTQSNGTQVQVLHVVGNPSGKVTEIHGVSNRVIGPGGERPGMSLVQAGVDPASCRAGTNLWNGQAVCRSRSAANVLLTFSYKDDAVRDEAARTQKLPPRDALELAELQRIIWTTGK